MHMLYYYIVSHLQIIKYKDRYLKLFSSRHKIWIQVFQILYYWREWKKTMLRKTRNAWYKEKENRPVWQLLDMHSTVGVWKDGAWKDKLELDYT